MEKFWFPNEELAWIGKLPGKRIENDSVQMMMLCCRGVVEKKAYGLEEYDESKEGRIRREWGANNRTRRVRYDERQCS